VRHPQTNGSTERLNQIIQNEFYKVAFRKKIYKPIKEIQVDLDIFMKHYIPKELIRVNIASVGHPCRPSTMEGLFINNMFLKTQRKEKHPLKIV
jgi:hypothetical protein